MWQWIVLLYVAVGLALVLFTRARAVISDSMADVTTDVYPVWKVATFQILLHAGSVLLWPVFLLDSTGGCNRLAESFSGRFVV